MPRLLIQTALAIAALLLVGCGRSDDNYRHDKTRAQLFVFRDLLRSVERAAPNDFRADNLEELSTYLISHDLAAREFLDSLRLDAWGRPIEFSAKRIGSTCECTLASTGPDGARGTADDVVLTETIVLPTTSQPISRM
jgi:hypothetical protein